jgi:hypothetical protein
MWDVLGTSLEIELMSSGFTTLWDGEKILGVYPATQTAQNQMVLDIQKIKPDWVPGQIRRTQ